MTEKNELTIVTMLETTVDKTIDYEYNVTPYTLALPFMWMLTAWVRMKKKCFGAKQEVNTILFDARGTQCSRIRKYAATWQSLDIIYNYKNGTGTRLDDFWINMRNAQAVRNRLKIIVREVLRASLTMHTNNMPVRILSLACGSAQGVLEATSQILNSGFDIKILLTDQDPEAEEMIAHHANRLNLPRDVWEFKVVRLPNPIAIQRIARRFKPTIVEMVGLLDYLNNDLALTVSGTIINDLLPRGGWFLTAHIHPNPEIVFLREVITWGQSPRMLYRTRTEFLELLVQAGGHLYVTESEPHGIHTVAVCIKDVST